MKRQANEGSIDMKFVANPFYPGSRATDFSENQDNPKANLKSSGEGSSLQNQHPSALSQRSPEGLAEAADLSEDPSGNVVSDDELFERYLDTLSGKEAKRRALRNVDEAQKETEAFWVEAHRRGEPLPRDFEYL